MKSRAGFERHIERTLGVPDPGPLVFTFYAHTSKEQMHEIADKLGLTKEARENFVYTGMEVAIQAKVDRASGRCLATEINGVQVASSDALGGIPV